MTIEELEKDVDSLQKDLENKLNEMNSKYKGFVFDIDVNNLKAISGDIKSIVTVSARQDAERL